MTKMNYIIIGLVLFGAINVGHRWVSRNQRQKAMAKVLATGSLEAQSEMGIPRNCKDKKQCITVFIAPWCGVCTASEPTFKAMNEYLQKNHPEIGFGIVAGDGPPDELMQKTVDLSPIEVLVDNTGNMMSSRGIRAFPTWVVNGKSGEELFKEAAGFHGTSEQELQQLVAHIAPK